MQNWKLVSLLIISLAGSVACKSSKQKNSAPAQTSTENKSTTVVDKVEKVDTAAASSVPEPSTYGFTVSFYSTGGGTDSKMIERFNAFVASYEKEKNVTLEHETNGWGREGEVDYCFKLDELSEKERNDFSQQAMKLLSESQLVHYMQNGQCHQRRR